MELLHGDCLEVMAAMEAGSVDAVVTDPPYGLSFMGKEWDSFDGAAVPQGGEYAGILRENGTRHERGFMSGHSRGRTVAASARQNYAMQDFFTEWATEALRVLKPSHYLLAFGGTRTWHRLACALEDAGFEIRDTLMWLYGSGFPKGKSCLKPAYEPIILARKPGPMRDLGIEECRVGTSKATPASPASKTGPDFLGGLASGKHRSQSAFNGNIGRWPANLMLECTCAETREGTAKGTIRQPTGKAVYPTDGPAVKWNKNSVVDNTVRGYGSEPVRIHTDLNCPCAMLDGQTVEAKPKPSRTGRRGGNGFGLYDDEKSAAAIGTWPADSGGGASRFFYCPKASRKERNAGCEGMERDVPDAHSLSSNACAVCGLRVKANGSGQKCECGDARETMKLPPAANHHPTVKPLALMRWLVKLVAQEGEVVLDPFMGSGTTGVACVMEGRKFLGIEQDAEYIKIAQARIAYARQEAEKTAAMP